jgi:hypothetical protein
MDANLLTAERDPAGRLFDEASRRLRTGELGQDGLRGLADRVEALAGDLEDDGQRVEMRAAARAVRDLPDVIAQDAVYGPLASSDVVAQVDRVVDWAWEDVHSTDQAMRRAREALGRLDRLRAGSPAEDRVLRAQRADLADRLAALEARRS